VSPELPGNPGSDPFDYGARTVRVLPGLDEAEGRMVAGSEAVRRTMAGEAVAGGGGRVSRSNGFTQRRQGREGAKARLPVRHPGLDPGSRFLCGAR